MTTQPTSSEWVPRGGPITSADTALHRAVPPWWIQDGRPTSQVFEPRKSDNGVLSVADGSKIGAAQFFAFSREALELSTECLLTCAQEDCAGLDLPVYADPWTKPPDRLDFPEHAAIDMRALKSSKRRRVRNALRKAAREWWPT